MKIRSVGVLSFHADGQADRLEKQDRQKQLRVAFRNFAKAPKCCSHSKYFKTCYSYYVFRTFFIKDT